MDKDTPQHQLNSSTDLTRIMRVLDLRPEAYRFKALPHDFDHQMSALIQECMKLSKEERLSLTNSLTEGQGATLLTFAIRMASLGLNQSSTDRIAEGLDALALEGVRQDFRNTIVILSTLRHSLIKLGHNPDVFIKDVVLRIDGIVQPELMSSLHNCSTIEETYIDEVNEAKGFRYRQNW